VTGNAYAHGDLLRWMVKTAIRHALWGMHCVSWHGLPYSTACAARPIRYVRLPALQTLHKASCLSYQQLWPQQPSYESRHM